MEEEMMKQYMKNKSLFRRTAFKDSGTVFKEDLTSFGSAGIPSYNVPGFILM